MCRLFAYCTPHFDARQTSELLSQFRGLAEHGRVIDPADPGHKSGWGIVGYRSGKLVSECKAPTDASIDPLYPTAVADLISREPEAVLAHLRKATCGGPTFENTHPFTIGGWSMAHNGNAGRIDLPCYASIAGDCVGETDSERYVRLFLQHLGTTDAVSEPSRVVRALGETVAAIRAVSTTTTSLSAVLTDGARVYGLRSFISGRVHDAEGYYTLFLGHTRDTQGVVLCSEQLDGAFEWELIPNDTVAIIDVLGSKGEMQPIS